MSSYIITSGEYIDEIKIVKSFIHKNMKFLPLFDNDYDSMVNDLFCECVLKKDKFDKLRGKYSTYLFSIMAIYCLRLNKIMSCDKRKSYANTICIDNISELATQCTTEEEIDLENLIKSCPLILKLSFIDGYSNKELSQRYAISMQWVQNLIKQELAKLRIKIGGQNDTY